MAIDIVIVNWNAGHQLNQCINSISRFGKEVISSVVLVDNASTDGSVDELDPCGLPIEIVRNSTNQGFARACNQGAAVGDAPYVLFLNPDTELFQGSLSVPLSVMEDRANERVGICGIQLIDNDGHIARSCSRFPNALRIMSEAVGLNKVPGLRGTGVAMREWRHQTTRTVDQVIGAFFFTRRVVFEELGGFDERFFVYFEEVDFAYRARMAGWLTIYVSRARAYHSGGGTTRNIKATRLFYSLRSRLLYSFKHHTRWHSTLLLLVTVLVEPLSRSVFSLFRGGWRDLRNTWAGYRKLYRDLPNILGKSRKATAT